MVVLCCIVVVTGFLPFPVSRSSLSSPPSQVYIYRYQFCFHAEMPCLNIFNSAVSLGPFGSSQHLALALGGPKAGPRAWVMVGSSTSKVKFTT